MEEKTKKYLAEIADLLSSAEAKIFELLGDKSKETVETKPEALGEIVFEGRTYKNFKTCKFKCGGLTSWATDYKPGDKMLHVHPTDSEILGFSEKGLDDQWHCPVVRKK